MSSVPFARLIDPGALDRSDRARGRLSIVVPLSWLREGARFELDLPERIRCDLCDGGGCDRCGRSGGYRLPQGRLPLAVTLPRANTGHSAVRVTNPVGDAEPSILVVHVAGVESADVSNVGVRWLAAHHVSSGPPSSAPHGSQNHSIFSMAAASSALLAPIDLGSWSARGVTVVLAILLGLLARWC